MRGRKYWGVGKVESSKHTKNKQKIVIFDRMFQSFGGPRHFTPCKRKSFEGSSLRWLTTLLRNFLIVEINGKIAHEKLKAEGYLIR